MIDILSPPEEIIAAYLVAEGIATRPGPSSVWPITTQKMPDSPDDCIKVSLVESFSLGKLQDDGDPLVYPRVQILVRSKNPTTAYGKGVEITNRLSALTFATITTNLPEDVLVQAVTIITPLVYIGQEEQNRRQSYSLTVQLSLD